MGNYAARASFFAGILEVMDGMDGMGWERYGVFFVLFIYFVGIIAYIFIFGWFVWLCFVALFFSFFFFVLTVGYHAHDPGHGFLSEGGYGGRFVGTLEIVCITLEGLSVR